MFTSTSDILPLIIMLQLVKWSSFLVSEWFDLLVSSVKVTIVLELYRRKWQGGNMHCCCTGRGYEAGLKSTLNKKNLYDRQLVKRIVVICFVTFIHLFLALREVCIKGSICYFSYMLFAPPSFLSLSLTLIYVLLQV